ncbi:RagB/SusD family nutrient uptake outer membrane protein [Sphingobacterium sp. CZ-UAM]|uniref:RagB/SusD family nutrient uptake outer membrane protein n=1 Tax=Sphingobacterium sp. CZ-UAM TaxID=1933868 RepID=UPI000986C71B|nr:RagB/SusD family nutrient uptake outer membrane protein [Sphingobacterium sp. CZ-UAM]OOG18151.1 RagB/SusD family nutrient uptake outer membrane protein [Sphingobacterium sp. CZ-UAM]
MKRINYIALASLIALGTSCKKDFLDRTSGSAITKEVFFNTTEDLAIYTNGLYKQMRAQYTDLYSDNIALSNNDQNAEVRTLLAGTLTPSTVSGWDKDTWAPLRDVNYMLDNVGKVTGDQAVINHYIGVARLLRANFYFKMVKKYGDVPWYSHVMGTSSEDLYKAKDPRTAVVDSLMKDLEFAAANVRPGGDNSYFTKWSALTLLSRVALHEGTFRKYHTELNLQNTAATFLERAASASQEIINNGGFSISGSSATDYRALFSSNTLAGNKEVIFVQKNGRDLGVANNTHTVLDWQWALSAELADEFLMKDGTTFTSKADYKKKAFVDLFKDRDPRLAETIMPAGFSNNAAGTPYITRPDFGGLLQVKFYPRDPALRGGWELNYTDLPIMRYAEVLLINAEAKAELGKLTQTDIDATVNKIRARVGMPALNLAAANATPDAYLANQYALVTGANKGVLLEIRRERRVELACEGFRFDDLYRWKSGNILAKAPSGMYIPKLGLIDVSGDGVGDIIILKKGDNSPIAGIPEDDLKKIPKFYVNDGIFYLENDNSGRIMFIDDKTTRPRSFNEQRYYYFPIPIEQTVLNNKLKQPKGWEEFDL